jgi:hypothetical protein
MAGLFRFPDPVNEVSARLVAAGVVAMASAALALRQPWLLAPIAYGFLARVLTGPTLSPLGLLVTRAVTPRLPVAPRDVPGPPKRFAQGIGAVLTASAAVLHFALGQTGAAYLLLGAVLVAATLEAVLAFCIGCQLFALLMRYGAIPEAVCERCNDIRARGPEDGSPGGPASRSSTSPDRPMRRLVRTAGDGRRRSRTIRTRARAANTR